MPIKKLSFEEKWDTLSKLPKWLQDYISDTKITKINASIYNKFKLSDEQIDKILNILILIYGRKISLIDLPDILTSELKLNKKISDEFSLELAQKHLWSIQNYIGGVEKLINSLKGELPKEKPISVYDEIKTENIDEPYKKEISNQQENTINDQGVQKNIKTLLEEKTNDLEQTITTKNLVLTNSGEIKKPSIKYWLSEYIQTLGAGYHPNLDRIGFLYNNPNAKILPDEERLVLGAVLKSYDDGDPLPFSETTGRLLVEKLKE